MLAPDQNTNLNPILNIFFSGDAYFIRLIELIQKAETEILIECYIFNLDPIGIRIFNALSAAAKRGVKVHILVDGIGGFNWISQLFKLSRDNKLLFRIYHPVPFEMGILMRFSLKSIRRIFSFFQKVNNRNHRKVTIIDRREVMMGSFNISQVHSEEFMSEKVWRDTGVEISLPPNHPEATRLVNAYFHAWKRLVYISPLHLRSYIYKRIHKMSQREPVFRLNSKPVWRYLLQRDLKKRLRSVKETVLVTNAYFLPKVSVLRHLRKAARRGVYVAIMIPQQSDVWLVTMATKSLYHRLMKDGVHIFEYSGRMLHAKTLVIDDWGTIGSHNLNHRSFLHDLECETVIREKELIDQLKSQWTEDLKSCHEVTMKEIGNMTLTTIVIARFVYWFRYWL